MEQQLRKPDWEYSPEIVASKNCEIWANVDYFGRNVIYRDSKYKIVVNSFNKPEIIRLFTNATINEKKIGELICTHKTYNGKKYVYLNYINIEDKHKGGAYSYRMINSLLSILKDDIEGIVTNYKIRQNHKPMKKFFDYLGGFVNEFNYLEIKNPKIQCVKNNE